MALFDLIPKNKRGIVITMNRRPSFLGQNDPLITCMIQERDSFSAQMTARNALKEGCDAFGYQLEVVERAERTPEKLTALFNQMGGKPIYITNYRWAKPNEGRTEDELIDEMITALGCGATLADIPSDTFCNDPLQFTTDPKAVEKQKEAVKRVHDAGGEVLMSCHTFKFIDSDEVMRIALGQQERGADISKIVTAADTEEQELKNLEIIERLRKELDIPFLFLCGGKYSRLVRTVGPYLGACMWLAVYEQNALSTPAQPPLSSLARLKSSNLLDVR